MKSNSPTIVTVCALFALWLSSCAAAQAPPAAAAQDGTVPVTRLIAGIAKKTGKKFLIDPRVQAEVLLIGQDPASLDYAGLLLVLQAHGFTMLEEDGYVLVVPAAIARTLPLPLVTDKETRLSAEYVGKIIPVRNMPAAQLVPLLRPLLPQQAHLVALPCTNVLMIADTFSNAKRIEKLVRALDTGEPYTPGKCAPSETVVKTGS